MKLHFTILLLACSCTLVAAEDMILKDGRNLKDIRILEEGADYVRVEHHEGIARVDVSMMTDGWKEKLHLTPEEVSEKKKRLAEQNRERVRLQKERDRQVRESLSEAEKTPRYLKGADILKMVSVFTSMDPIEAEAAALRWNMAEAQRVGMSEQADLFKSQLASYEPNLQKIQQQRQEDELYWKNMQSDYERMMNDSREKMASLSSQINSIRKDLKEVSSRPTETRTVVYREPYYTPQQIIVPRVERETVVVRPPRIYPPRPVNVTTTKNSISIGPGTSHPRPSSDSSHSRPPFVRPAEVRPAMVNPAGVKPAQVHPAIQYRR